ncbi:hypothetical protein K437DRAFT_256982 [Tilletiaria anomala UBC 951]|uniref:Ribosomal RNA-processing protein 42 n=1 Tax=Tilletiaria anomala (strain ATCC 24038 / CBS 436.72 / UBC 951) TaxID=1037660 RepID=A0A066W179_TILAU|nr:uncharacterized protein K437DRAFT_256982 [Tilletiaria anomala UBC 951]KDN44550.1 hypothetical protein K437DRAFT_256982 [Tilletiaria anomala UBC 951]
MPAPLLSTSQASYILSGLLQPFGNVGSASHAPTQRSDLRPLHAFRSIHLQTDVVPTANASARVNLGGTDVTVGISCQVDIDTKGMGSSSGKARGGMECSVQFSNALVHSPLPTPTPSLDALSVSLTSLLTTLGASVPLDDLCITPPPNARYWILNIDAFITSLSGGNVEDALVLAANAALQLTRIPRTRAVSYEANSACAAAEKGKGAGAVAGSGSILAGAIGLGAGTDTVARDPLGVNDALSQRVSKAIDFELLDLTPESGGRTLSNRNDLPVCVTVCLLPVEQGAQPQPEVGSKAHSVGSGGSAGAHAAFSAYVLDPTLEEQDVLGTRVHVLADKNGRVHGVLHSAGASVEAPPLEQQAQAEGTPMQGRKSAMVTSSVMGTDQAAVRAAVRAGAKHACALAELVRVQLSEQEKL